jgi:hypothetical protein
MAERWAGCREVLRDWDQRRILIQALEEPKQAAHVAGEGLRWLNHLLGRFRAAADVYDVLAQLAYCLERMPQALEGMTGYVVRQHDAGRLRRDDRGDVLERVAALEVAVKEARDAIGIAARAMRTAHHAMRDVHGPIRERRDG